MRHGFNYLREKAGLIHPYGLIGTSRPYRKSGYTPAVNGVSVKLVCALVLVSSPKGRHKKTIRVCCQKIRHQRLRGIKIRPFFIGYNLVEQQIFPVGILCRFESFLDIRECTVRVVFRKCAERQPVVCCRRKAICRKIRLFL